MIILFEVAIVTALIAAMAWMTREVPVPSYACRHCGSTFLHSVARDVHEDSCAMNPVNTED